MPLSITAFQMLQFQQPLFLQVALGRIPEQVLPVSPSPLVAEILQKIPFYSFLLA